MSEESYPWKVEIRYPWELIELVREGPFDKTPFFFFTISSKKGGRADGNPHTEKISGQNCECYVFADGSSADSFVKEVQKMLDKCTGSQLRKVIEKNRDGVVGQRYTITARRHVVGKVGCEVPDGEQQAI